MVLARLLIDRGELQSRHGQVMIGITLVEDLAVVVLTVLLPVLGALEPGRLLAIGGALVKSALILAPLAYLAWKVVPTLLLRVARTGNDELFLMVALALGLGTAALTADGRPLGGARRVPGRADDQQLRLRAPDAGPPAARCATSSWRCSSSRSARSSIRRPWWRNLPLLVAIIGLVVVGKLVIWALVVRLFGLPAGHGAARRHRPHPDRRVLVHPRPGRPRGGSRRRRRLQRDAGRLAADDPDQRHARPPGSALARAPGGRRARDPGHVDGRRARGLSPVCCIPRLLP